MKLAPRLKLAFATLGGAALLHVVLAACGQSSSSTAQCQTGNCNGMGPGAGPGLAPSGSVMAFAGTAIPGGWLVCDGSAVSRTQYAGLFAAIGASNGAGDGVTTFQLPDYRGRFLRGVDQGSGRDPDAPGRTAPAGGGNSGDSVGSLEAEALAQHTHGVGDPGHGHAVHDPGHSHPISDTTDGCFYGFSPVAWSPDPYGGGVTIQASQNSGNGYSGCTQMQTVATGVTLANAATGVSVLPAGGAETRPVNVAVTWIIKT
jgi:microcystin-dependent protein